MAANISTDFKNDYGYSYTDAAIAYLLNKSYPCDYLMFTNGDNLYSGGFIDGYIGKDMHESIDIIGFNFISHYQMQAPTYEAGNSNDGTMIMLNSNFKRGEIDLGAFVIRLELLNANHELRFVVNSQGKFYGVKEADGYLIYEASKLAKTSRIHRQSLMIHQ